MEPQRSTVERAVAKPGAATGDRRGCVRQIVHSPVYVSTNLNFTGTGLELHEILDAGESGIALQGTSQLPVGHRVQLRLDLAENTEPGSNRGSRHLVGTLGPQRNPFSRITRSGFEAI